MCSVLAWADILAAPGPRKVGAVIPVDKTGLHCGSSTYLIKLHPFLVIPVDKTGLHCGRLQ